MTSSSAGQGGPSRTALRNAAPPCLPLGWLVVSTPAVGCDQRQHDAPALGDQILVGVPIALAHCSRHPRKVELDRSPSAVLEVDEERPVLRVEHVPRMRLAVQQLLGSAAVEEQRPRVRDPVGEELAVVDR